MCCSIKCLLSLSLSDTPLGVACGRSGHLQCIMPLLSAGAHIDFRGKDGLTPMHRAAIGGNAPAVNVRELINLRVQLNVYNTCSLFPKPALSNCHAMLKMLGEFKEKIIHRPQVFFRCYHFCLRPVFSLCNLEP